MKSTVSGRAIWRTRSAVNMKLPFNKDSTSRSPSG